MLSKDGVTFHVPLMKQAADCIGDNVVHLLLQFVSYSYASDRDTAADKAYPHQSMYHQ